MIHNRDDGIREIFHVDKYLWLNLVFVFLYIFISQTQGLATVPAWSLWLLFAFAVLNAGIRTLFRFRYGDSHFGALTQVFVTTDILLLSIGIGFTSGIKSDLWLIYFIAILSHSLYVRTSQVVYISILIVFSYPLATLPAQWGSHALPWIQFGTTLALRLFFILIIGTYTRQIWMNEEVRVKEVQALREQMATGVERTRIAREIHDGLGHALVSAILRLELCQKLMKRAPEEAETILKEEIPALREAWSEGRNMAFHLRPWEAGGAGEGSLEETLRRHIDRFSYRTGLKLELSVKGEERELSPSHKFGLTRVVQEALTNVVKHAGATSAVVEVSFLPGGALTCTIRDNGAGFSALREHTGVGTKSMSERIASLGGTVEFLNCAEGGAEVRVALFAKT